MVYDVKTKIKTQQQAGVKPSKKEGIILDLSDLHYTVDINEENEAYLLTTDIKKVYFDNPEDTLSLNDIDFLVISGDFVEFGNSEDSFKKAFHFIDLLSKQLNLPYEKIVIVPGNHDLSWTITMDSYRLTLATPSNPIGPNDKVVTNVGTDIFYLKRNDAIWYQKFKNYSDYLYEPIYGTAFPINPKEQLRVTTGDFIDGSKVAFFGINTAANIDQFNRDVTYFDTEGLIQASRLLPQGNYIKIVVGHHPVDLTNSYGNDIQFANAMQDENFKIYLHGHVHRTISLDYLNPQNINPNMIMIGAGALSVSKGGLWPGVPERYNVIKINNANAHDKISVSVNTRQREYIGTFWQPAYIYYEDDDKTLTNIWSKII